MSSLEELHAGARLNVIGAPWCSRHIRFGFADWCEVWRVSHLWPRIALAHEELRNGPNRSAHESASGRSPHYGSGRLVRVFPDIAHTVSSLLPWAVTNCRAAAAPDAHWSCAGNSAFKVEGEIRFRRGQKTISIVFRRATWFRTQRRATWGLGGRTKTRPSHGGGLEARDARKRPTSLSATGRLTSMSSPCWRRRAPSPCG